jgi:uncharacterized protein YuzE
MRVDKFNFDLTIETDNATGEVLAVYIQMREGKAAKTVELADGTTFADYNSRGKLLGIELLAPCEVRVLDQITRREPAAVKRFLHGSAPRKMVVA